MAAPAAELTFIGTATSLLRIGPFTLLTDPNFLHRGERAYLGYGLWSRRLTEPALSPAELPVLDAVVLSHLHGDHWDRRARAGLDHNLPVLTTPHAARRLRSRQGFPAAVGLATWQAHTLPGEDGCQLTVTSVPGIHAGNPVLQALLPPVMGSVIELADGRQVLKRVYITGDTLPFSGLAEIAARFPAVDTAVVHTGGTTLPGGFVVTMTGADAAECLRLIRPAAAVPVHYDDYGVFRSGLDDVRRAVSAAGLGVEMRYVHRGESVPL
jgi:L-ascorbate metabolism protein UlaG (beta-lactamase superfamily)